MPPPVRAADTRGGMSTSWHTAGSVESLPLPLQYGSSYAVSGSSSVTGASEKPLRLTVGNSSPLPDPATCSGMPWNPRASMAFDNAKGLLNPAGENNCFLNSAVQVLWHLDAFRRNFRQLSGHACLGHSCIFCALKIMFTQFQFSDCAALPPDVLRDALARSFVDQQRYQLGFMDDAAECFENILLRIHAHLAHGVADDVCQEPHCIPHRKFSMTVVEQAVCQCGATAEPFPFTQIVHYVSTRAMVSLSRNEFTSFGRLLNSANEVGETRKCPKNCGGTVTTCRTLANNPDVVSIGFVWDSDRPSYEFIQDVVTSIQTVLYPADMFFSVADADWAVTTKFHLVGVVCYYGRHYSTFFFHSKMKIWILFDDSRVKKMGPDWLSVVDRCIRGRYQPLLLLYANPDAEAIDVSTAPQTVVRLPEPTPSSLPRTHILHRAASRDCNTPQRTAPTKVRFASDSKQHSDSRLRSDGVELYPAYRTASTDTVSNPVLKETSCNTYDPSCYGSARGSDLRYRTSELDGWTHPVDYTSNPPSSVGQRTHVDDLSSSSLAQSKHSDSSDRLISNPYEIRDRKTDVVVDYSRCSANVEPKNTLPDWCRQDISGVGLNSGPYIKPGDVKRLLAKQNLVSQVRQRSGEAMLRHGRYSDPVRCTSEQLDSMSISSHKDSGYRSSDDRQSSGSQDVSPTLSASNSNLSISSYGNFGHVVPANGGQRWDTRSMCSSSESLSSVQSTTSLPASFHSYVYQSAAPVGHSAGNFSSRLKTIPECQSSTAMYEETSPIYVEQQQQQQRLENSSICRGVNSRQNVERYGIPTSNSYQQLSGTTSRPVDQTVSYPSTSLAAVKSSLKTPSSSDRCVDVSRGAACAASNAVFQAGRADDQQRRIINERPERQSDRTPRDCGNDKRTKSATHARSDSASRVTGRSTPACVFTAQSRRTEVPAAGATQSLRTGTGGGVPTFVRHTSKPPPWK